MDHAEAVPITELVESVGIRWMPPTDAVGQHGWDSVASIHTAYTQCV